MLYIQCIGLYINDARRQEKGTQTQEIVSRCTALFREEYANQKSVHIKALSFIFSCLSSQDPSRLEIFEELVGLCIEDSKEYLFLPYLKHLNTITPIESAPTSKIVSIYKLLIEVVKRREKHSDLSKLIIALFETLSTKPQEEVMTHSDQLYRCLTYLITDEEKIFFVENFLTSPLVRKIFAGNQALKASWGKFISGDLEAAEEFYTHNHKYFSEEGWSLEDIKDKMRFYKISQIADANQQMLLSDLAAQLQSTVEGTELFLIKVIQYGYVDALIDQMTGVIHFRDVHNRNLRQASHKQINEEFNEILEQLKRFKETHPRLQ